MKKFFAALIAVALVLTLLVGCGGSTGTPAANSGSSNTPANSSNTPASTGSESGEIENIKMIMISVGFNIEDAKAVNDKINEYIEPLINTHVDIEWLDMGEYLSQINVRLASGEAIDVLPVFGVNLSSLYSQEALKPLDELLAQYGTGIAGSVGEKYLKCGQIGGVQYAIPIVANFASEPALLYRTDIVEELGIDLSGVKSVYDLEPIFEQVKAAHPEMTCICANSMSESQLKEWAWDGLGDEYGVLMNPTESTEVVNLFETQEYMDYCKLMREWYEKGYVMTDIATTTDNLSSIFETGMYFGTIAKDYPGNVEGKFSMSAYPFAAIPLGDAIGTTQMVTSNVMTIPATSEHPEAAMKYLNLLYTDATLQNLQCYGIEGQDYRLVDGVADYLEGEFIMTAKYVSKYNVGNYLLAYNFVTDPENIHQILLDYNENSPASKGLGFSYDSSSVANELTAIANVCNKYRRGIEGGSMDPEVEIPNFVKELKAAGIDTVIAEKQAQFDAWLANQ